MMRSGLIFSCSCQPVQHRDFAVTRRDLLDGVNLAAGVVAELGAENVVRGHDALQGGAHHLHRRRRDHVKVEVVAVHLAGQKAIEKSNVRLQAHAAADFVQILPPHPRAELGVVQQQVHQFAALLHQVQLRHAPRLALEFLRRNPHQLTEHVAGVVEAERLVKVAGEDVSLAFLHAAALL